MAENKKFNPDEVETIETTIAAENIMNDDIVEYIQPSSSLEMLKARYAAAEEDESIRNEGFELVKKGGLLKKSRPESTTFDYYSTPVSPKDEIRTDVDSPLSKVFDSTKSEFDADAASFSDIEIEKPPIIAEDIVKQPLAEPVKPVTQNTDSTVNNRYGFDTHTRIIYFDESADDGIKRNSDEELSSAFVTDESDTKRRFGLWKKKNR